MRAIWEKPLAIFEWISEIKVATLWIWNALVNVEQLDWLLVERTSFLSQSFRIRIVKRLAWIYVCVCIRPPNANNEKWALIQFCSFARRIPSYYYSSKNFKLLLIFILIIVRCLSILSKVNTIQNRIRCFHRISHTKMYVYTLHNEMQGW